MVSQTVSSFDENNVSAAAAWAMPIAITKLVIVSAIFMLYILLSFG
jgi:hypothetical protein